MQGQLYIDGHDAFTEYGVYIVDEGLNDLIAMPPLKPVVTNDWQEEDGVEADLLSPKLNTKDVQLKVAVRESYSSFVTMISLLSDGAYHTFDFASIQRSYTLRLVSVTESSRVGDFALMNIKLADDFPLNGYTYAPPVRTVAGDDGYTLDGTPLSEYGIRILKGSLAEVAKTPDAKTNLLRNIKVLSGAIYDPQTVTLKAKEVKLYGLMTAPDIATLWRNWDALLYDLTRPNERTLYVSEIEQEFEMYYKSCRVTNFYPTDKIWLEFMLTLVFTHNLRLDDGVLLATEDGGIVVTQNADTAIDMKRTKTNRKNQP